MPLGRYSKNPLPHDMGTGHSSMFVHYPSLMATATFEDMEESVGG